MYFLGRHIRFRIFGSENGPTSRYQGRQDFRGDSRQRDHVEEPAQTHLQLVAAILCTGGADVIRKEAWPFYRTISGVRLCWELEEPKGPKRRSREQDLLNAFAERIFIERMTSDRKCKASREGSK